MSERNSFFMLPMKKGHQNEVSNAFKNPDTKAALKPVLPSRGGEGKGEKQWGDMNGEVKEEAHLQIPLF